MAFYKEGSYNVEILDNGVGESEKKQTPFIFIRFKVLTTETGEAVKAQYERDWRKYITEATIPWVAKDVKALGIEGLTSFIQFDKTLKTGKNLAGNKAVFVCKHEEGTSGTQEKWEVPFTGGGEARPIKLVDQKGLMALHQKFGAKFAEAMAGEDDLPF